MCYGDIEMSSQLHRYVWMIHIGQTNLKTLQKGLWSFKLTMIGGFLKHEYVMFPS